MTIFKFAVLRGIRNPLSIILNFILPIALILATPIWSTEFSMGYYYMAMAFMYGAFIMARGIINDKIDGTIVRILSAPVTTLNYLFQNLLACLTPLFIEISVVCVIGTLLHSWEINTALSLGLCYGLFITASVTFSFAWSCLFKNREVSYSIFSILMSLIALLSGFWIPINMLPDAIKYFGALFPSYWVSNGINSLLIGENSEFWLSMAAVLFFTVAYLLFAGKRKIT